MAALLTIVDTPTNSGLGDPAPTAFNKCNAVITAVNTIYATDPLETAKSITPVNPMWPFLDARRYGIDITGATDSTLAMQRAHSMGLPINYPAGTIQFSAITMPGGGIIGAGFWQTFFRINQTTADAITVNYNGTGNPLFGPTFSGFNITATSPQTGGNCIIIDPVLGTAQNEGARFLNIRTSANIWNGINFAQCFGWNMIGCEINAINVGVFVDNTVNADAGVASIVGGVIGTAAGGTGIHQVASGGLKVTGVDILGGAFGILLDLSNTGSTSDLLITGCSIEGQTTAAIQLQRQAGSTQTFKNVMITGCEFEPHSYAVYTNDSSGFLSNLTITGCTSDGFASSNAFYVDYVSNVCIDNNAMQGGGGGVGTQFGIHNGKAKYGASNIMDSYGTSLIPGTATVIPGDPQTGTTTITTSGTLGSLFSNTATITFATAFAFAPSIEDVQAFMTTAATGVAVNVVSVSATQLVIQAVGTTNSSVVPVSWAVRGVI